MVMGLTEEISMCYHVCMHRAESGETINTQSTMDDLKASANEGKPIGKDFGLKAYEKWAMVRRDPDSLRVMVAEDEASDSGYSLVLTMGTTPIAKILSEFDLDFMEPDWKRSDQIQEVYDEAYAVDDRQECPDFDDHNVEVTKIVDVGMRWMGL